MAPPSASSSGPTFDVFLNFRGEDTRNTFTRFLYDGLNNAGIYTFFDSEKLHIGKDIGEELLSAIERSKISIPIFSKTYAESKWCLKELAKIVECSITRNQLVLPIFYDVDPSDVRHSTTYEGALQKHRESFDQKIIDEWRQALKKVGGIKGWDLKNIADGHEATLVREVVAEVSSKLIKDSQIVSDNLVGIQSHVAEMMSLLNIKSEDEDVKIVGVWGLGGIGKTTIAKFVYNEISHYFEGCSFLENVRESSQHYRGLIDLQNQLVTNLLKGESFKITTVNEGINVINERFCKMKVLIVLDDVEEKIQLDAFIKKRDWFGSGSRIIITTRDAGILTNAKVGEIYEPSEMDASHSLQLFSKCAFRSDHTPDDFLNLSKEIVRITGGLPLALEVIGSSLSETDDISEWEETLERLRYIPHDNVEKKLKISYDGLTGFEKAIFLDIACFCNGMDKNIACFVWKKRNFSPKSGIRVLCQKSLVKIGENNELKMHDQLKDLGKGIVFEENNWMPGERSRLWSHEEALEVLEEHTGTKTVEGLCIDFGGSSSGQSCLTSEGFAKMNRLRLLQVDYAQFAPDFVPSFSQLIWLRWKGCPLDFRLKNFHPVNLVVLDLSYSLVSFDWTGWDHIKVAKNLKVLNLTGCKNLSKIPQVSRLEVLILENCVKLECIDESIEFLERLVTLNMRGCAKLRDLPYGIGGLTSLQNLNLQQCETLEKLPDSLATLLRLETFDASFCYIKDGGIPDAIRWLSSLKILRLGGNDFHSLPVEVSSLSLLQTLDLRFCDKLESLLELPSSLKYLNVLRCTSLKSLPGFSNLTELEVLCLDGCKNLKELKLPGFSMLRQIEGLEGLDSLELLTINQCKSLRKMPKLSDLKKLRVLKVEGCEQLHEIEGFVGLDSLNRLIISWCKSLRKMPILSDLKKLKKLKVEGCEELHEIEGFVGLDSLVQLTIRSCKSLRKMPKLSDLKLLSEVEVESCEELHEIEGFVGLDSLVQLTIRSCKSLTKMPKLFDLKLLSEVEVEGCEELHEIEGFVGLDSLVQLTIRSCKSLRKIPILSDLKLLSEVEVEGCEELHEIEGFVGLDSLVQLTIRSCKSLRKMSKLSNLKKLKKLKVEGYEELHEIEGFVGLDSLVHLIIRSCKSLKRMPKLCDLKKLKKLKVEGCEELHEIEGLVGCDSLNELTIKGCKSLIKMPELSNFCFLRTLEGEGCEKLHEIEGSPSLNFLIQLIIKSCKSLIKMPELSNFCFLRTLEVEGCEKLHEIEGSPSLNFLIQLIIKSCKSLRKIPKLSDLTILRVLEVEGCSHEIEKSKDYLETKKRLSYLRKTSLLLMAPPSLSSSGPTYDVFLNFRGEDTRNTFTGHLYNGLDGAKIRTFIDSENLHIGEDIGEKLLSTIQRSKISIPIFSKKYAESKWCLKELAKIVECSKTRNQLVLPIFYDVDPSDVRNSTGTYADDLNEHGKRFDQRIIEEWKQALGKVGAMKGWDLKNIANGHDATLVTEVVAEVCSKLIKNSQIVSDHLVGIQSHVAGMMSLLNIKSEDEGVKTVGVRGFGGIGKTTIAKVVYNTISHYFEGCSFVENVREASQYSWGLVNRQNQLVSDLLKGGSFKITNKDEGINVISERFRNVKVLIVLDDVEDETQLKQFIGKRDWFGLGSRIIITTRDAGILANGKVDEIYEPSEMDCNDSLQLFTKHAFRSDQTPVDFLDLSQEIVRITGGIPLALEVIGSSLFCKTESVWKETLKMLQEIPYGRVLEKLQISFDGLTDLEKEIFLDIACFFIGMDKNIACSIWQQCNFYREGGIEDLCRKSMVKIGENNELKMHDQIRDLGREMVRQENYKVPGERSRLWSHKVALDVLKKHTGTKNVEGLCIDFGGSSSGQFCLTSEGFAKMNRLRLLQVDYAQFAPGFEPSFSELIWLRWKGCPLDFRLKNFHPVNLVVLDLSYSHVSFDWTGWDHIKVARNLKVLNLTGCQHLSKTPELANHHLEVLILENCVNLVEIDESIEFLERLVTLNMRGCTKLKNLPYGIGDLTSLRNLIPDSIATLRNLETFDASFCYIKDGGIPAVCPSPLKILRLGGNDFHSLPMEVSSLSVLQTLDLRFCDKLESLPELPSTLKYLNVLRCRSLKSLPWLSNLTNLEVLCLDDCGNLVEMPALLGLRNLVRLNLDNCHSLKEIGSLVGLDSLHLFAMKNCGSLRKIGKMSSLRKLKELKLLNYSKLCEIEGLEGLDSLGLLTINRCTSLRKIPKLSDLKKLTVLEVDGCEQLLEIEGDFVGLDSLDRLSIKRCSSLRKIPILSYLKKLMVLEVYGCKELLEFEGGFVGLDFLDQLTIDGCTSLRKIPKLSDMKKLTVLKVHGCNKLLEFEDDFVGLDSLDRLDINQCTSLRKIPKLSYLKKLTVLEIYGCKQLPEFEGDFVGLDSLDQLTIGGCTSLRKIPKLSYLKKLTVLKVHGCNELLEFEGDFVGLDSLDRLDINRCTALRKIPKLSDLKKLRVLKVDGCKELLEFEGDFVGLDSLDQLTINWCTSLRKIPKLSYLKKLTILEVYGYMELLEFEGGFVGLDSLDQLTIHCCTSFKKIPKLSDLKKLTVLEVYAYEQLLEFEGDFVGLDSLDQLTINRCTSLRKIPKLSDLKKLRVLKVDGCHELFEFEGDFVGLDSLDQLTINWCTSLRKIPKLSDLKKLRVLKVHGCNKLLEVEGLGRLESLETVEVMDCQSMDHYSLFVRNSKFTSITARGIKIQCLSIDRNPNYLDDVDSIWHATLEST